MVGWCRDGVDVKVVWRCRDGWETVWGWCMYGECYSSMYYVNVGCAQACVYNEVHAGVCIQ